MLLTFSQPVDCIFWPIRTLNWLVPTSKLHKHWGTCCHSIANGESRDAQQCKRPVSSAFLFARKCNWLTEIMLITCVRRHEHINFNSMALLFIPYTVMLHCWVTLLSIRYTVIISCSGLIKTGLNNDVLPTLFTVVKNIVQHCYTWFMLHNITLFNPVFINHGQVTIFAVYYLTNRFNFVCVCTVIDHRWRYGVWRTKKYARDVVECSDFLFFTRYGVICDLLQYRSTKKWNLFVSYHNKVGKNHVKTRKIN